jgi:hypothetical protein
VGEGAGQDQGTRSSDSTVLVPVRDRAELPLPFSLTEQRRGVCCLVLVQQELGLEVYRCSCVGKHTERRLTQHISNS